jgi:hypothetical protein
VLHDPPREAKWGKKRANRRVYALRKPKNYSLSNGDLVQIDTLDVNLMPGVAFQALYCAGYGLPLGSAASLSESHR